LNGNNKENGNGNGNVKKAINSSFLQNKTNNITNLNNINNKTSNDSNKNFPKVETVTITNIENINGMSKPTHKKSQSIASSSACQHNYLAYHRWNKDKYC